MGASKAVTHLTQEPPVDLGHALAQAFDREPNFTYIFPDATVRRVALPWFLGRFVVRLALAYGAGYTTGAVDGAALWLRPDTMIPLSGALRAGLLTMPFRFGWGSFRRSLRLGAYLEQLRQQRAPAGHWYLMTLGVAPAKQGHGLGRALLVPILRRADTERRPCYLETFSARTVAFYAKQGFTVAQADRIPKGGPAFWTMVRPPRRDDGG